MIVGMCSVYRQPIFGAVRATLGMCALALPIFTAHKLEQLRCRGPGAAERIQGGGHLAIVVIQTPGICVLIVALNQRMIFNQRASESKTAGCFTVSEMMNYLYCAP